MKYKIIMVFLITTLLLGSIFVSANCVNLKNVTNKNSSSKLHANNNLIGGKTSFGYGGWHPEEYRGFYGKNYTSIEGDWEYWGTNSIRESPNDGDDAWCKAYFDFNDSNCIGDTCVKYLTTYLRYKCFSAWGDGPQIKLYNWDTSSWWTSDQLGRYSDWHISYVNKTGNNANDHINDDGQVSVIIYAWDSDDWWSGDDFVNNWVFLEFQTADEEIYEVAYEGRDDNNDGLIDGLDLYIDVDVGLPGDGTTVDVTAYCELVDPNGNVIDDVTTTWNITDWEVDPEIVTLSALGGPNGDYTIKIWLYDEFGNNEDYVEGTVPLEPEIEYVITFYCDPSNGGVINFGGGTYNNGQSAEIPYGTYDIEAKPNQGYKFIQWSSTGGVNVVNKYAEKTKATISNDGSLTVEYEAVPFIYSDDSLIWSDVKPKKTVTGSFSIENVGGQGSQLNWEITDWPEDWGTWTFTPKSGINLPSGQSATIEVEVVAPKEKNSEFSGSIIVVNLDNPDNSCTIPISLTTPRNKNSQSLPLIHLLLQKLLEKFPILSSFLLFFENQILGV